jgi:hypothetical protein
MKNKYKLHNSKWLVLILTLSMIALTSSCSTNHNKVKQNDGSLHTLVACDIAAGVQQCCSAAKCKGNVLSNRDKHNCKVKSNGTSWHDAAGNCTNRL